MILSYGDAKELIKEKKKEIKKDKIMLEILNKEQITKKEKIKENKNSGNLFNYDVNNFYFNISQNMLTFLPLTNQYKVMNLF
jgi:hypothetical protein